MLKRYQVLLNDWMAEYLKFISQQNDWSFSEALRLVVAVETINWVSSLYPKSGLKFTTAECIKRNRKWQKKPKTLEEEYHKAISAIYFEARKAVEHYIKQEKKKKL